MAVAEEQSAGRGRYGRSWYSPAQKGLYVSYLLFPRWPAQHAANLNELASLAVLASIRGFGEPAVGLTIKLPNDVLIGGRKVCGILTEVSTMKNRLAWAIVGIGVNLYQRHFPNELVGKATSLALEGVTVRDRLAFCERLTEWIEHYYRRFDSGHGAAIHREFTTALAPTLKS